MTLNMPLERLNRRVELLRAVDGVSLDADQRGVIEGLDAFSQQALGILTSSRLVDALDLTKEDERVVAAYGEGESRCSSAMVPRSSFDLCIARRLVEAGARVVTLNYSRWDWHGGGWTRIFEAGRARQHALASTRALTALVSDLHQRGLDQDCTVVISGEFGRTPRISDQVGRDHWPQVNVRCWPAAA